MIIAVDGPAASGKGTIARRLAQAYGLAHLDTGLLYRAVGMKVLKAGFDPADEAAAERAAQALRPGDLEIEGLRGEEAGKAASVVAAQPGVRRALVRFQRNFVENPPGGEKGAVLDGRDIGTVVCPEADIKLFVTADLEVRALRRYEELQGEGRDVSLAEIRADIAARDKRDSERAVSPLRQAQDAHLLNTSNLDIEAAVAAACAVVDAYCAESRE